ncbi:MAG: mannose-1-phosphate guanylyltransferase [Patescibacteria group bacterium]|nr:mannose-1-phosphate guanylyltransferase [Patescibacteria group bacterium]
MDTRNNQNYYVVILAGGGGTRLWPKSRQLLPKQFLKLAQDKTLLQETFLRAEGLIPAKNVYVVSNPEQYREVIKQLPQIPPENVLVEPLGKNTAPAIGLAVKTISLLNPKAVIGSFASDHLIKNKNEFIRDIEAAFTEAKSGDFLVTVGIPPTKADDGLGYIHIGKQLDTSFNRPVFAVKKFVEKPDLSAAKAYVASGEYFWNASYFIASAGTFAKAYQKYLPQTWEILEKISGQKKAQKEKLWRQLEPMAIDYGIMEKADNIVMIPGDFGWSDLGSWPVLYEVLPNSINGNVFLGEAEGKHIGIDTKNCLIYGDNRVIATIGVSDLVIVDTEDVVLITTRDRAQEVKKIVEKLKSEEKKELI